MRKILYSALVLALFIVSCTDKRQEAIDAIDAVNAKISEKSAYVMDTALAKEAIAAYEAFYTAFPDDSLANEYRFSAADICMNSGQYKEGIALLDEIIKQKEHPLIPQAMHMKAFIYDEKLKHYSEADKAYKALIDRFPDHQLSEDARNILKLLGKSPDEVMEMFKQMNAAADSTDTAL